MPTATFAQQHDFQLRSGPQWKGPRAEAPFGRGREVEVTQHCHCAGIRVTSGDQDVSRHRLHHTRKVGPRDAMIVNIVDDPLALTFSDASSEDTTRDERGVEPRRSEDRMIVITPPESESLQKLEKNAKCLVSWLNESRMSESLPWDSCKHTTSA